MRRAVGRRSSARLRAAHSDHPPVALSIVSLSVLIAVNGIVSTDRKKGYYRFLFAKPVSAGRAIYAQLFFVYMAGMLSPC